ncbi:M20 metallopeptidase family protein [Mycoplasma sp. P36-A1]|uniref:M20 metallopeptidase family protein n=1 Tax=Mycoplasma sp. P36-A1 TaxID=3252900 RepID=UPI003C2D0D7C
MNYLELINLDNIVKWRNHIHQNPELSFEEYETSQYIYDVLKSFEGGLVLTRPTKTSVVATLDTKKPGKCIALRADIDALPMQEEALVEYKSKVAGKMHACGHDTHAAMLLGAIEAIIKIQDKLTGKMVFIFQHAEELLPGGARELVEAGVVKNVDEIFGLHIAGSLASGMVASRLNALTASTDTFEITLSGKGSHGSTPELSIDLIVVGSEIVSALQTIVSRTISTINQTVVTVGQFNIGSAPNIIAQNGFLSGTVRTTNKEVRIKVKERIETIVNNIAAMYDAKVSINYIAGYSSVINEKNCYEAAVNSAKKVIGQDNYIELPFPQMGGEDFSAYTDIVPGCFLMVGGGSGEGYDYFNHHPMFRVAKESLLVGAKIHMQIILDNLEDR